MEHESGSPAWGIDAGDHRKWFDWWRIVTGVLTVPFLVGSVFFLSLDDAPSDEVATIVGLYLLAVAGSFGAATLLRSGSGGRGVFTVIGLALGFILALLAAIVVLLLISYESHDVDHEGSCFEERCSLTIWATPPPA